MDSNVLHRDYTHRNTQGIVYRGCWLVNEESARDDGKNASLQLESLRR